MVNIKIPNILIRAFKQYIVGLIISLPFFVSAQIAPVQNKIANYKSLINKLENYKDNHTLEKIYLHFDKPYYAAGDTIYFKAYLITGDYHELSQTVTALHIDLITPGSKIQSSILLKSKNGLSWGDFILPDTLPKGEYRIRAYTNRMRDNDLKSIYYATIPVVSTHDNKNISSPAATKQLADKPDLQFFPEGGNLVNGIKSKIGFKAVGANGLGLDVTGIITDDSGKTLSQFESTHLGMGYFYFQPEKDKKYQAVVTFRNGKKDVIDLPAALDEGITLAVNDDSLQKASVKIEASKNYYLQNKGNIYKLIIYAGGVAIQVDLKMDSGLVKLDLVKKRLHTGVAVITLFSPANEPLCERLLFIQNHDQLTLSVTSDKSTYVRRQKTNIRLNAKNRAGVPVSGHFSVSVSDEGKVPSDDNTENTILSNILLTSDLKGYVEQPGYYFDNINEDKQKKLDILMLTQGYRRLEWRKLLAEDSSKLSVDTGAGLEIAGLIRTFGGKPIPNGDVSLVSLSGGPVLTTKADNNGNFKFTNLDFPDSAKFLLQGLKANGNTTTELLYKPVESPVLLPTEQISTDVNQELSTYLKSASTRISENLKYEPSGEILLKEVTVKDIKSKNNYRSSNYGGSGHADQVIHMDDIPVGKNLVDMLDGRVSGVVFSGGKARLLASSPGSTMLIVVDGTPMTSSGFSINMLNPEDIETVEALKYSSAAIYGMNGGAGVLIFTTRQGTRGKENAATGLLPISPRGYYKARTFYSPMYLKNDPSTSERKDLRSTIYWNPEIITDANGDASFDYYNADGTGTYNVVIEGIDEKGNLGRAVYKYSVIN